MKKAVAIYGGPRRSGNTEILLDSFLAGIDRGRVNVDKVVLNGLSINPCNSCYGCRNGRCVVNDDMTGLYEKLLDSDIIILASPIYFGSVSSLAKIMIDRCQAFWAAKFLAKVAQGKGRKKGYFIATAGSAGEDLFAAAKYTVKYFFAACGAEYFSDVLVANTDVQSIRNNRGALEEASDCGKSVE